MSGTTYTALVDVKTPADFARVAIPPRWAPMFEEEEDGFLVPRPSALATTQLHKMLSVNDEIEERYRTWMKNGNATRPVPPCLPPPTTAARSCRIDDVYSPGACLFIRAYVAMRALASSSFSGTIETSIGTADIGPECMTLLWPYADPVRVISLRSMDLHSSRHGEGALRGFVHFLAHQYGALIAFEGMMNKALLLKIGSSDRWFPAKATTLRGELFGTFYRVFPASDARYSSFSLFPHWTEAETANVSASTGPTSGAAAIVPSASAAAESRALADGVSLGPPTTSSAPVAP